jgi:hypothetical protein
VYCERITFYPGGIQTAGSGPGAHAWVVWDKAHAGPPELRWLRPGYKARYGQIDATGGDALPGVPVQQQRAMVAGAPINLDLFVEPDAADEEDAA